ncbi:MAG: DEAD/DEAH box helicase, partial [Candidatus Micrarchaeota archaeon]
MAGYNEYMGRTAKRTEEEWWTQIELLEKGRKASFGSVRMPNDIRGILKSRGVNRFFSHQAKAICAIRKGKNVVIIAPTASGKTESYLVPVIERALEGINTLVIYPTKALSRDQLERFREFSILGVTTEIYDGDTSDHMRRKIRGKPPHVLITNMDMLHYILMNNGLFRTFLKKLGFVVVDEIHTYSGMMGAHASHIIRRLKRIAGFFGSKPKFIACSATISNAPEFCELLFGEKFVVVDATGAPKAGVRHILVNPSISYVSASLKIAERMLAKGSKTLVFGNSHSVVERIGLMAKRKGILISVYRGGLTQDARKRVELEFKRGKVGALATTSALELGVDIGSVDSVVLSGFPGSITKTKQRIGRAGRKGRGAEAYFVARDNPLDQYYFENTHEYLRGEPESCYVNPDNAHVSQW